VHGGKQNDWHVTPFLSAVRARPASRSFAAWTYPR
jgi:hypothetical protein